MRQRHIILIAVLMTLLPSCILEMEVTPAQPDTVELTLCGDIIVPESALGADALQTKADVVPTIKSLRVLVFDASGSLVSNTLFNSGWTEPQWSGKAYISSISGSEQGILASVGTNYVYLVVNERVGGDNLVSQLLAVQSKNVMDDDIRTTKVEYTDLIPVNDEEAEPPFLMCVYDEVTVLGGQVTQLDITGLSTRNPIYGFPMRRTMAKIILDSVTGGVEVNGNIVGTEIKWNGNASDDQIAGDTGNDKLKATSAIHILGLELVNVPKYYSWEQNKNNTYPTYSPELGYRADPIPMASFTGQNSSEYFAREWDGSITVSGNVPYTRVDKITDIWKVEGGSGGNAYATVPADQADQDPAYYYVFTKGMNGHKTTVHNKKLTDLSQDKYDKVSASGYDHYTIENGNIRLWRKDGSEITDVPNNQVYTLNSGNFITWYQSTYNKDFSTSIPGTPVAGAPESDAVRVDPSVWTLDFGKLSYYIPENVQPIDNPTYTRLRITASIAVPTAVLDPVKIQEAIEKLAASGETGDLVQDDTKIEWTEDNIMKYMYAKGELIPHTQDPNIYALKYAGLSRVFGGTIEVGESTGQYDAITGMTAQKVTIEVPLNNGNLGSGDNNIYRGREYHVNLYFTDGIDPATRSGEDTNSVTFNVDGQEYALTASVSVK